MTPSFMLKRAFVSPTYLEFTVVGADGIAIVPESLSTVPERFASNVPTCRLTLGPEVL